MTAVLAIAASSLIAAASPTGNADLVVKLDNLRNAKGLVRLCLTANPAHFPDCKDDPAARTASVDAAKSGSVHFEGLAPGRYAISAIHDENGNGKLDTMAMMPREGFGFSRNPAIHFGPPKFGAAQFVLEPGANEQHVKIRYML